MNNKRDEVIEAAIKFELSPEQYNGNATTLERMADFTLSRETELRRKIADELDVIDNEAGDNPEKHDELLTLYIEKLRGNK